MNTIPCPPPSSSADDTIPPSADKTLVDYFKTPSFSTDESLIEDDAALGLVIDLISTDLDE